MAEIRKSGKQATARKQARERAAEKAAEFRLRQDQLEELAAEYFVSVDGIDGIEENAEKEIAAIRARTAAAVTGAREKAGRIVQRMLDTSVTRDEVAARLGIPVRDVKRSTPAANAAPTTPAAAPDTVATAAA
ncbi:hypothetical protein AX769_22455 (plasmid) [Frondihabitans sp. PAMC 28766]|uniref:hypothetical protein n=1 Tax=Frondihabitans sp. PAMC 28766 TaxID=1795630 RepID=UPI00078CCC67|nr:hypothetical protein [Frondihabitans sp. PAMC 28766]AMM22897.1 hypothetical protein AX769_22455 [Frondihabitans sp. PAMC 28766]